MKDQRPPLRFPAQRKARAPKKLKPATKDCPRCENMLNRRMLPDSQDGPGFYVKLPPTQCTHRGRNYKINGLFTMVLCICCLTRFKKKSVISARIVRPTRKAHDAETTHNPVPPLRSAEGRPSQEM